MSALVFRISKVKFPQFYLSLSIKSPYRIQKHGYIKAIFGRRKNEWLKYSFRNIFGKYLLITNTLSSGILMSAGDLIQQQLEYFYIGKNKKSFDWQRNMHMGTVGILLGPFTHFFYQVLDKYVPGNRLISVVKKIFLDQLFASPLCIVIFFVVMNYLSNIKFDVSVDELKKKFWVIYAVDCSIWIPFQFINFYCLSTEFRVIYVNIITMCYNVFLSFAKHY